MIDYNKFDKSALLDIIIKSSSIEEFMNKSDIRSLDKDKPKKRFNEFFKIDINQLISNNRQILKIIQKQEYDSRMVECDYCHTLFRYGDHPSNNKKNHNFCCNDHKNLYIASFSKNKTKHCSCKDCGCDVIVDIHASPEYVFCHDCLNKHDYSKPKEKRPRKEKRKCIICGNEIGSNSEKFCSPKCYSVYRYNEYIKRWKLGIEDGMKGKTSLSNFIRKYMFEKYDNRCARCGWSEINPTTNKIPLEVEHIDGNHKNNKEENLILLCPNCHSLTPTYRSLNYGHGRERK